MIGGNTGVVWFQNGGKSLVVVHELFHTFGLVPGARRTRAADFHVLDDANDLMRSEADPSASGSSGTGIAIDANHDDYFNPALSSDGKTAVAIGGCQASQNLANTPWVTPGVFPDSTFTLSARGASSSPTSRSATCRRAPFRRLWERRTAWPLSPRAVGISSAGVAPAQGAAHAR